MPLISKKLAEELKEKDFRDAFLRSQTNAKVVQQLRALRRQRGVTQGELAAETGTSQSVIARYENADYEGWGVSTLIGIAAAHDVGLVVEFVPYEEFLRRTANLAPHALEVDSFSASRVEALAVDLPNPPGAFAAPPASGISGSYNMGPPTQNAAHLVRGGALGAPVNVNGIIGPQSAVSTQTLETRADDRSARKHGTVLTVQ